MLDLKKKFEMERRDMMQERREWCDRLMELQRENFIMQDQITELRQALEVISSYPFKQLYQKSPYSSQRHCKVSNLNTDLAFTSENTCSDGFQAICNSMDPPSTHTSYQSKHWSRESKE